MRSADSLMRSRWFQPRANSSASQPVSCIVSGRRPGTGGESAREDDAVPERLASRRP